MSATSFRRIVEDLCIIYQPPQYRRTQSRQSGLLQENGFLCRGAQIRKKREERREGRKCEDEDRTTLQIIPVKPSPESVKFPHMSTCYLPPFPPCWPDKGTSLHQSPPRISHLSYRKGRALAQSSAQAGKSSLLLFISQVTDDPRLSAMAVCPQYAL